MAEIHPPETHPNNGGGGSSGGGGGALTSSETVGSKRQRRPSVRLGEIGGGDQLYESQHHRRTAINSNKQWKQQQQSLGFKEASKSSKTRALTNLSEFNEILDGDNDINLDSVAIGSWRLNHSSKKRGSLNVSAKRVRSNWVSKFDDSSGGGGNGGEGEEKYSGGEDIEEEEEDEEEEEEEEDCREFDVENSETLLKEQSRIRDPLDDLGDGNERNGREVHCYRRVIRGRNDRNVNHDYRHDGVDLSGPSDNDMRDYRNIGGCGGGGEDGVRIWLNSLGLGRYAPVFEIHEVDDEVLPKLTLEDLKDMGISAVGSRRKMFCAIQKLGKGFS
ncbi:hypothetical protein NC652_035695 [Populus alba x Populus x berolinensis]|uniref:SAM domain-containing protein n=1 Tax=Populus tomentosa TaxID=118781 RepID=A0A8X8CAK8_POPTO|nr:hypothetical protein POTOM_049656 [Populus tomentosa]KAJ6876400.1 hypothetical protein NC652_035695 [Populus alba x Populus x berolinensis]